MPQFRPLSETKFINDARLVGYWKLNESSGNASDSSVNGYTMTNSGGTYGAGKFGNGITLGETNSLSAGTAANLRASTLTYSAWVKTSDTTNNKTMLSGNQVSGSATQWGIDTNLKQQFSKQNVAVIALSTTAIPSGTWCHIAVTYDSSTGACKFYTNGVYDGGGTSAQTFTWGNFGIGFNHVTEGFIGDLDDIAVFNGVLSQQEVMDLYQGMTFGEYIPNSNTKGYWRLNGNSLDFSGNGNHGTDTNITYSLANGRFGQGAGFNGSTSKILLGTPPSLNVDYTTVSCWFKTQSTGSMQYLYYRDFNGTYGHWCGLRIQSDGALYVLVYVANNYTDFTTSILTTQNGKWNNASFTFDGSNVYIYFNGLLVGGVAATGVLSNRNNYPVCIGSKQNNYYFNGSIDEVIVENVAWTPQQIAKYFTMTKGRFGII